MSIIGVCALLYIIYRRSKDKLGTIESQTYEVKEPHGQESATTPQEYHSDHNLKSNSSERKNVADNDQRALLKTPNSSFQDDSSGKYPPVNIIIV